MDSSQTRASVFLPGASHMHGVARRCGPRRRLKRANQSCGDARTSSDAAADKAFVSTKATSDVAVFFSVLFDA